MYGCALKPVISDGFCCYLVLYLFPSFYALSPPPGHAEWAENIQSRGGYFLLCPRCFLLTPWKFSLSALKKFVTNLLIFVTNFLTRVTKFVICVTKFVTKTFLYGRKKYLAQNKKYLGEKKHFPRDAPSGRVRKVWVAPRPVRLACQKIITFAVDKTVGLKKKSAQPCNFSPVRPSFN